MIAFGKIEWDIDKNLITFEKPNGIYKNKNQILENYNYSISKAQCGCFVLGLVGFYLIYKAFRTYKNVTKLRKLILQ